MPKPHEGPVARQLQLRKSTLVLLRMDEIYFAPSKNPGMISHGFSEQVLTGISFSELSPQIPR